MYHKSSLNYIINAALIRAAFILVVFPLLVLALLICDTAAGLAGRLARGLAFAATAILCAVAKIAGFNSLNMLHYIFLRGFFYIISLLHL
jgi:hypothetical protein